jgi:hypothetical protein
MTIAAGGGDPCRRATIALTDQPVGASVLTKREENGVPPAVQRCPYSVSMNVIISTVTGIVLPASLLRCHFS